jgi:endonuclease/exonuclease/phosphatase family metal-dependent hydrolase
VHQPRAIAEELRMENHFCAAHVVGDERYGHAILSRHPCELVDSDALPTGSAGFRRVEHRAVIRVRVSLPAGPKLEVFGTHLGLRRAERAAQVRALLSERWCAAPDRAGPTFLVGDFNLQPRSPLFSEITRRLPDAHARAERTVGRGTWPAPLPILALDHVFVDESVDVLEHRVAAGRRAAIASDHRPVIVDVAL